MKITIFIILLLFFMSLSGFADMSLFYASGDVTVSRGNVSRPARVGDTLLQNDKVKTAAGGKAVLIMDKITRIWVKPNTEMEITSLGDNNFFSLLVGKIRAKVSELNGRKFAIKSPVAVAAVRGTDFSFGADGELVVFEHTVSLSDIKASLIKDITQGQSCGFDASGGIRDAHNLSPAELDAAEKEWKDFAAEMISKIQHDTLRSGIRQDIADIKTEVNQVREITNEIKESDLSAGRTLRDANGNMVRVEEDLVRPNNSTIEFIDITKRSNYTYVDRNGWGYNGTSGSRLDVADVKITMNMALPDQITQWPNFISSQGDNLHPQSVNMTLSNPGDNNSIQMVGQWTLKGGLDAKGNLLSSDELVMNTYINGWKVNPNYDASTIANAQYPAGMSYPPNNQQPNTLYVWGITPQLQLIDPTNANNTVLVRLFTEGYGINNSGSILQLSDFVSSSQDPFSVLKQVAAEQIVFCRNLNGADYFHNNGNLDIVYTPDLVIAVAEKLAGQVGNLTQNSSSLSSPQDNQSK